MKKSLETSVTIQNKQKIVNCFFFNKCTILIDKYEFIFVNRT